LGGNAANGDVLATATTGSGSYGGAGGSANGGDAGTFNASNTMSGTSLSGSNGINVISQNTGANALVQQGVTVQANINK
jgi:hypothetical protein